MGVEAPAEGGGVTAAAGDDAGRNAISAASSAPPTTMPARRPPRIATRGDITGARAYQYDPVPAPARPLAYDSSPMRSAFAILRLRVLPAALTGLGVMLIAAGVLSYADPTTAGDPLASPVVITAPPETPSASPSASTSPSAPAGSTADPSPSVSPSQPVIGARVATRLLIPALRVDLPVIEGPAGYPPCDVAMYLRELGQPGEGRAIYLYAHARAGMLLSMLDQSKVNNGRAMLGMLVQVYTDDDQLYLYEISEVRRHQRTLERPLAATSEELWIQTSEGPNASYPKLQVVATPLSVGPADPAEAHPEPRPRAC